MRFVEFFQRFQATRVVTTYAETAVSFVLFAVVAWLLWVYS